MPPARFRRMSGVILPGSTERDEEDLMATVIADMSVSLDGFVADPSDGGRARVRLVRQTAAESPSRHIFRDRPGMGTELQIPSERKCRAGPGAAATRWQDRLTLTPQL